MASKTRSPLIVVGTYHTNLEGQPIDYTVKRSTKARYVRYEIRLDTGLTIVIPKHYNIGQIHTLLRAKQKWILSKLAGCQISPAPVPERELKEGDCIPYLGRILEVRIRRSPGMADCVGLEGNKLVVNMANPDGKLKLMVIQWYQKQAAEIIKQKVDELSEISGLPYNRIFIRTQRTRWGSCSHKRNLSFNWKLMMAPESVVDYVIIHELSHLKEMNHTNRFWKLVVERCPQWRERKRWLREHEAELADKLTF